MQASDYTQALTKLLPPGGAWNAAGTPLGALLEGLAAELARVDARAVLLLREARPGESSELLPDWERVLGLPDTCITEWQSLAERRLAAGTKYGSVGGQSAAFFIQLAAGLGYVVTIQDFPSAAAATAAGVTFTGDGWAYTWRVNVGVATQVRSFRVGTSGAGEALREWGDQLLECTIKRFAPAHTIVLFSYL